MSTERAQLNATRYVMRQITSGRARSALIVAGVAIAVAFFVLFASMSAGLNAFIDEELERPRTTHVYLEPGTATPFSPEKVGLVELVAASSEDETGVSHVVTPRARFPISTATESPMTLWGVEVLSSAAASPPYDTNAPLAEGRHLNAGDGTNETGRIPVVLGHDFAERAGAGVDADTYEGSSNLSFSPGLDVDPWRMPDATEYPLEGRTSWSSEPRGPVRCKVVGILAPGQGEDLDWGAFVPLDPLMRLFEQRDGAREKTYYPQVVITIEDASTVDVADLEESLMETLPGIQGTDDHWDVEEFRASYGGAVTAFDGWLAVVAAVLAVMLVAGVSDTTLVAVTDRRREIATLRAVGIGRRQVARLVLTEVLTLAGVGLVLGLVLGSALAFLFGRLHEAGGGGGVLLAPTSLDPLMLAAAAALALGSAVVAALYPASRAARQTPMEALRYE